MLFNGKQGLSRIGNRSAIKYNIFNECGPLGEHREKFKINNIIAKSSGTDLKNTE